MSESDGSVLGEFSSLCLLSSNNNRLRSSCVHKCIIVNQKTQITRSNTAVFAKDSLIYALKIKQQSEHKRSPPHLRHALQTSTHLLAGFLAHHVRAEWVSVIRRPCLTLHVPGDYKVSASVFPRQVTHPLSEQLLSLRLGFPQLLLDLHDIQQGRAVRGLKFIRITEGEDTECATRKFSWLLIQLKFCSGETNMPLRKKFTDHNRNLNFSHNCSCRCVNSFSVL